MKTCVLLTGCSKGLGLEICKYLLKNEYLVIGVSRTLSQTVEDLLKNKYFKHIIADLGDENSAKHILDEIQRNEYQVVSFINNAAVAYDDLITNLNTALLKNMYQINVFTPMLLIKGVIRNFLLYNTAGSIINVSSISVHTGYKGLSMYASTKGALEALTKNLAREWGERSIRVNNLVCGFMETEMSSTLNDEQKNRIYNRNSLKKPTEIASVAATIEFLITDKACSITGQNIFVDSGTI